MKVAIISDIHGNDLALEAVLADIDRLGIADTVNLGDHLSGPLNPARTADVLMARDIPSISGNHDRYLLTLDPADMGLSDRAAHAELQPLHIEWLATLPATRIYRDAFFLCHGTPASDETYWLEALTAEGVVHQATRSAIEAFATGIKQPVILCGHTHIPGRSTLRTDGSWSTPAASGARATMTIARLPIRSRSARRMHATPSSSVPATIGA